MTMFKGGTRPGVLATTRCGVWFVTSFSMSYPGIAESFVLTPMLNLPSSTNHHVSLELDSESTVLAATRNLG